LNANRYFNKPNVLNATTNLPRPPLRYNNFGYNIGGPVYIPGHYNTQKNKTFFFFSEEWRKVITYTSVAPTMPTAAELKGTFTTPVCVAFAGPTNNTCTTMGTQVATIDPVAAAYIKDVFSKIPLAPDVNTRTVFGQVNNVFNGRQELARVDHVFGPKLSVFGRFIHDDIPTEEPGALFQGTALPNVARTTTNSPGHSYIGKATVAFTPTFLMEAGYNYSYGAVLSNSVGLSSRKNSPDVNAATTLPFAVTVDHIPNLSGEGASGLFSFGPYLDFNRNHSAYGNMTKVHNSHTFKWGVNYNHYNKSENNASNNSGTFTFSTALGLGQPSTASSFQRGWANFLEGRVSSFSQLSEDLTADIMSNQWEAFGQDEWRVRKNLTLSLGVRWEYYGEATDGFGRITNFDPKAYDPTQAPQLVTTGSNTQKGLLVANGTGNPLDGIIIGGKGSPFGDVVTNPIHTNFAPRVGIAWDPYGDGKTSIRTGYGIYYDNYAYSQAENTVFNNPPFVNSPATPQTTATNPGGSGFNINLVPKVLRALPIPNHTPYTQQWSLGIQHEFPGGWFSDISYVGTKGTHLTGTVDLNMVPVGAAVAAGLFAPGSINTVSNLPVLNLVRPYRGFGPINAVETIFGSNYHSLQTMLQKRMSGNSLLMVSYTFSHGLTDSQSDTTAPQNTYNVHGDYGPLQFDRRHVVSANYVYEIPWLQAQQGLVGHVLGGWELSGIISANSGIPLTVSTSGVDPALQGILGSSPAGARPYLVGNPNNGPKTIQDWFNLNAFQQPTTGGPPGTAPRGSVIGPGFWKWDASLFKNFKLTERAKLQFRAEAFNVLNHTNLNASSVSTNITSVTFGQVTGARDPRFMQLALKLNF
jgi:TonB dependent receptor